MWPMPRRVRRLVSFIFAVGCISEVGLMELLRLGRREGVVYLFVRVCVRLLLKGK